VPNPTIDISSPAAGAILPRTFGVSGTYTPANTTPSITIVLKDSAGNVVATATNVVVLNGTWSGTITAGQGYNGASVVASLPGAPDASVGNLTIP
jgi:hypothetical protein